MADQPKNPDPLPGGTELAKPEEHRPTGQRAPLQAEVVDPQESPHVRREVILSASYYAGSYPPPEYFEQMERIVPGSAKLIMESYLKQSSHRQTNENKVIAANIDARVLGMQLGAFLSALGIIGGCVVAAVGFPMAGTAIAGSTALALATSFLKALAMQRKELEDKKKVMDNVANTPALQKHPGPAGARGVD